MSSNYLDPIDHPSAWLADDLKFRTEWLHVIDEEEIAELDEALKVAQKRNLTRPPCVGTCSR
jgi:hypothetical protein